MNFHNLISVLETKCAQAIITGAIREAERRPQRGRPHIDHSGSSSCQLQRGRLHVGHTSRMSATARTSTCRSHVHMSATSGSSRHVQPPMHWTRVAWEAWLVLVPRGDQYPLVKRPLDVLRRRPRGIWGTVTRPPRRQNMLALGTAALHTTVGCNGCYVAIYVHALSTLRTHLHAVPHASTRTRSHLLQSNISELH